MAKVEEENLNECPLEELQEECLSTTVILIYVSPNQLKVEQKIVTKVLIRKTFISSACMNIVPCFF